MPKTSSLFTTILALYLLFSTQNAWAIFFNPVTISSTTINAIAPQVATNPATGQAVAVWSATVNGNSVIQSAELISGTWTLPVTLSIPTQNADTPYVTVNRSGQTFAIWESSADGGMTETVQVAQLVNGTWTAPINLFAPSVPVFTNPRIKNNDNGQAVAVWTGFNGVNSIIQSSTYVNGAWTAPVTLSPAGENANAAKVAINNANNAIAVWEEFNGTVEVIAYSELLNGVWTPSQVISDPTLFSLDPEVAYNNAGLAVVVWQTFDIASGTFFVQAEQIFNNIPVNAFTLSPIGSDASMPQVALNDAGLAVVVWQLISGTNTLIQSSTILGGTVSGVINLTQQGVSTNPQVALNNAGKAVAVWQTTTDGVNFSVQSADYMNGTWTAPLTLSASTVSATIPQVAISDAGQAVTVWQIGSGTNTAIQADLEIIPPSSPSNIIGKVLKNKFVTQTDRIFRISFTPSTDPSTVAYLLRRNGVLIVTIPVPGPSYYDDHNRHKNEKNTYTLTAINAQGLESTPLTVVVPSKKPSNESSS